MCVCESQDLGWGVLACARKPSGEKELGRGESEDAEF